MLFDFGFYPVDRNGLLGAVEDDKMLDWLNRFSQIDLGVLPLFHRHIDGLSFEAEELRRGVITMEVGALHLARHIELLQERKRAAREQGDATDESDEQAGREDDSDR